MHSGFSTLLGREFLAKCHVFASFSSKKSAQVKTLHLIYFCVFILKSRVHLVTGSYLRREIEISASSNKQTPNQWFPFANEKPVIDDK